MTKAQVKIGCYYLAKVSGQLTIVQMKNELSIGKGWSAINMISGRRIIIRSSRRLRREVSAADFLRWKENRKCS